MARGGVSTIRIGADQAKGLNILTKLDGPLFTKDVKQLFVDEAHAILPVIVDAWNEQLERRFKPGKGLRTGALKTSLGEPRLVGKLSAAAWSQKPSTERYAHRVEYGSVHMSPQRQRKNSRRYILRNLEFGGKYYNQFVSQLTAAYNGGPL